MATENMNPLFRVNPRYNPSPEELNEVLPKARNLIQERLNDDVLEIGRLGTGQNLNFRVRMRSQEHSQLLLRVITRKGYPSVGLLEECSRLLDQAGIKYAPLVFHEMDSRVAPYGLFLQQWVEGTDALARYGEDGVEKDAAWLKDFIDEVKKAHQVALPYFGYLGDGPKYGSLVGYYDGMAEVIDQSFGELFRVPASIWDIHHLGLTSPGFLPEVFSRVSQLARQVRSPFTSGLVHGDMLPANLIYTGEGGAVIDWDEARANCWVYDLARVAFYMDNREIVEQGIDHYRDKEVARADVDTVIRLEHVRQMLRYLFLSAIGASTQDEARERVRQSEGPVLAKLQMESGW
jgi:hypothetical protein